jgi:hypothetical protein
MAWTYRRRTRWWQRHLNRVVYVALAVLGVVFLVEVFLLLFK